MATFKFNKKLIKYRDLRAAVKKLGIKAVNDNVHLWQDISITLSGSKAANAKT